MQQSALSLDTYTLATLAGVMHRLDNNGLFAVLTVAELRELFSPDLNDETCDAQTDHAFRKVVWLRLRWLLEFVPAAYDRFDELRADGCMWCAVITTVGEYEHRYVAAAPG